MTELAKKRPEFRNINAFKDLTTYRMAPAAWVSILHRASGVIMFLLLPFILWMFDTSLSSEISFAKFKAAFNVGLYFVPGWFVKLVALALIWAYLHHFIAGLRHFTTLHLMATDPEGPASGFAKARGFFKRRDRMMKQAGSWTSRQIEKALSLLVETDMTLRSTSRAPAMAVMERTLIRITRRER